MTFAQQLPEGGGGGSRRSVLLPAVVTIAGGAAAGTVIGGFTGFLFGWLGSVVFFLSLLGLGVGMLVGALVGIAASLAAVLAALGYECLGGPSRRAQFAIASAASTVTVVGLLLAVFAQPHWVVPPVFFVVFACVTLGSSIAIGAVVASWCDVRARTV